MPSLVHRKSDRVINKHFFSPKSGLNRRIDAYLNTRFIIHSQLSWLGAESAVEMVWRRGCECGSTRAEDALLRSADRSTLIHSLTHQGRASPFLCPVCLVLLSEVFLTLSLWNSVVYRVS